MSRSIYTKRTIAALEAGQQTLKEDQYVSQILKLIPAEIISAYLAVFTFIKSNNQNPEHNSVLQLIVFGIFLLATPFYLSKIAKITSAKQIAFCTISFIIWVFSIGGPLAGLTVWGYSVQFLCSVLLPIYTIFIPLLYIKTEPK